MTFPIQSKAFKSELALMPSGFPSSFILLLYLVLCLIMEEIFASNKMQCEKFKALMVVVVHLMDVY